MSEIAQALPSLRREDRASRWWIVAVLPAILALLIVFAAPFLILAARSLHLDQGLGRVSAEWTATNYVDFFTDPFYLQILGRTFLVGAIVVAVCIVLAYPVAYVITRLSGRLRGIALFLVVAPLLISLVIRNLGMFPILGESGLVNTALRTFGIVAAPLVLINNIVGVEIGLVHALLPFMILSLVVAMQSIDPDVELAALGLGAAPWRVFFRVVVPLTRPGLLAGSILVFTLAISAYTTPAMLGGNRVLLMSTYIGKEMMTVLDYAFASTCAVVLVVMTLLLTGVATAGGGRPSMS